MEHLSPRLKTLVDESVTVLGEVIKNETGLSGFRHIEKNRKRMAALRGASHKKKTAVLRKIFLELEKASPEERMAQARAFTLMLEVMNACENAYRNFSIREKAMTIPAQRPDSVIYVLTAHPTEARAPENIWVFHELQKKLSLQIESGALEFGEDVKAEVRHLLAIAWRAHVVRDRKPHVSDEAEHIFSTLLREETLRPLLAAAHSLAPVFVRSWVGGDKDGHPGVNEKTFKASLQISRELLLKFSRARLAEILLALEAAHPSAELHNAFRALQESLPKLRLVKTGDGRNVFKLRRKLWAFSDLYEKEIGATHPALLLLQRLTQMFPALVVPLEFRESSDMLPAALKDRRQPICRMLKSLSQIALGGDPRWYVRGMIISMTEKMEHILAAATLVKRALQGVRIPVIPLFEQAAALDSSPAIVKEFLGNRALMDARQKYWQGYLEIMVGYSDSSKQSGVLPSRLKIAEAMHKLDRICAAKKVIPLFFQGSGGSVDRGGGSIAEQTAWWPSGALRNYKVTIQGEMVERSMASPEITWRQIQRIVVSAGRWKELKGRNYRTQPQVDAFACKVAAAYGQKISDPNFLRVIERATPYLFLDRLRIGSRPTKRATAISVGGLRAIPWVLCWTQTRVLFPTWWGIGSSWTDSSPAERKKLVRAFGKDPVFTVFVRALSYTMAKVELPVWQLYLERSKLTLGEKESALESFSREKESVMKFLDAMMGRKKSSRARAWLYESIELRSPMIHTLNLLQLLALEKNETDLLRITVTGIANGMVATG
ncbi:MAG: phosphoenolpyruvate carboxylase [Bdellovibrionota bacterium]